MEFFFEWLRRKYFIDSIILEGASCHNDGIPSLMLVGYMINFCDEYNISYNLLSGSTGEQMFEYLKKRISCFQKNKIKHENFCSEADSKFKS